LTITLKESRELGRATFLMDHVRPEKKWRQKVKTNGGFRDVIRDQVSEMTFTL
jgi:hypothetical protein